MSAECRSGLLSPACQRTNGASCGRHWNWQSASTSAGSICVNLRGLARGKPCMIRQPAVCNFNSETTVLCHLRMAGITGMGMKANDILGAWGCSDCHRYVDTHGIDGRTALLE